MAHLKQASFSFKERKNNQRNPLLGRVGLLLSLFHLSSFLRACMTFKEMPSAFQEEWDSSFSDDLETSW